MPQTLAIIIESDLNRRRILTMLVRASASVDVSGFESYDEARSTINAQNPTLVICPWQDGGAAMIADRIATPSNTQYGEPDLLILAKDISAERIEICRRAGRTQLIPSAPLNLNALRNRILLQLEGPDTLARRLSRSGALLRNAVESLPALRRRLAL